MMPADFAEVSGEHENTPRCEMRTFHTYKSLSNALLVPVNIYVSLTLYCECMPRLNECVKR